MSSYIGANSQGIIGVANTDIIDGSTIKNATLDSTNTFNFANDSISGDKINGGTISNATLASNVTFPAGGTGNPISVAIIAEQFAYNVDSGASAGNNLREINTEISDTDGIVTISGSPDYTFTITNTGLYLIEWVTTGYLVGRFYSFLTNSSDVDISDSYSSSIFGHTSYGGNGIANGFVIQNLSTSETYKLKTYHQNAQAVSGGGFAHDVSGDPNNYSLVKITKLK